MAIVNMNRVSVLLMRKDEKAFLRLAQRCGCVHLVQAQQPQAEEAPARDGMETARQQELSRKASQQYSEDHLAEIWRDFYQEQYQLGRELGQISYE